METMWTCKIGVLQEMDPPPGADDLMRAAIAKAFLELTGTEPDIIFSEWGAKLSPVELAIIWGNYNLIPEDPNIPL